MSYATRRRCCLLLAILAGLLPLPKAVAQSDWFRFRGPDGSGHCPDENIPVRWGAGDIVWQTKLEGLGNSSVCVWKGQLFLTAARQTDAGQIERRVLCLNRGDGNVVWQQVASVGSAESVHKMNSFASPTCVTDGQRVVAFFGRGGIHCYDMDGKRLWSHDLGEFPGPWGTGASPIMIDDLVIQNCDAGGQSFFIAFNKETGETVWRTDRGERPRGGWSTPFVIDTDQRRELILNGEHGVRGYDPADGRELWFCQGFNGRGTPVPARGNGLLVVVSGKPGDIYAVRPGGQGDVTKTHMAWHTPRGGGRDLSSPIVVGHHAFVVNMMGIGTCYDATNGKELWRERLGGNYSASPIAVNGLIYIQNESGETLVIEPGDSLKIIARNDLGTTDDEIFRSTLVPSNGQLLFRSNRAVYCVGKSPRG